MRFTLRPGRPEDAPICGPICHDAFKTISEKHGFPPDFPNPEVATRLLAAMLRDAGVYSVVAEIDGRPVGSNFMTESDAIAGIGPITVDPNVQDSSIGRALMENVLERARAKRFAGVRLVQAAFHARSMSLYTKLGFDAREPLVAIQGKPLGVAIPGRVVRRAVDADAEACDGVCRNAHGHDRAAELRHAIHRGTATVVEAGGRVTGYATVVGFFGHAVGETNDDVAALVGAAREFPGPGFLLPIRNAELFRWCLAQGLRVVQPMTLMSVGLYNESRGAFLPSILY
jgi:predicted N-acetyltransferase YhbS